MAFKNMWCYVLQDIDINTGSYLGYLLKYIFWLRVHLLFHSKLDTSHLHGLEVELQRQTVLFISQSVCAFSPHLSGIHIVMASIVHNEASWD